MSEINNRNQVSFLAQHWQSARKWIASERVRRVRAIVFQVYVLIALLAFAGLALLANTSPVFQPDVFLTRELQSELPAWFAPLLEAVSVPGYATPSVVIMTLVVAYLAITGLRWEAISALFAGVGSGLLNTLVKVAIRRPRPGADMVNVFQNLGSYSFPSGHVMFYTTFFGFLLFLTFILLKRNWRRTLISFVLLLLILLVGLSRMYLGEHWGSDVLGGYLLGSLTLILTIIFYRWGKARFLVPQPVASGSPADKTVKPGEQKEIQDTLKNPLTPKKEVHKELHEVDHPDRPQPGGNP